MPLPAVDTLLSMEALGVYCAWFAALVCVCVSVSVSVCVFVCVFVCMYVRVCKHPWVTCVCV